jgi:hypothetical protein
MNVVGKERKERQGKLKGKAEGKGEGEGDLSLRYEWE